MSTNPVYTPEEARTRETFLALMWALSYPGRVYTLPFTGTEAFLAIADTVLDLETSYFTADAALDTALARSGARRLSPEIAAYHFYPTVDQAMLTTIEQASTGSLLYPDQSATLFIGCKLGTGTTFTLTGPGIPPATPQRLLVDALPATFWPLRASANRYPLGWDIYLIDDTQVVGLPRTTQMTLEG